MAAIDTSHERLVGDRHFLDRASWGALFAGFFVGLGLLFLLLTLGAAVGFTTVDPRDAQSWRNAGLVAGIWGGISAIIASFGSAWVAGRLSQSVDRGGGALHGLALWGLTWAVLLWVSATLVTGAVGGAASAAGTAMQAAGDTAAGSVSGQDAERAAQGAREQVSGAIGQAQQQIEQNKGEVASAAASGGKKGAWGAFLAALFTMIASAIGGAAGAPHLVRQPVAYETQVPSRPLEPQRT